MALSKSIIVMIILVILLSLKQGSEMLDAGKETMAVFAPEGLSNNAVRTMGAFVLLGTVLVLHQKTVRIGFFFIAMVSMISFFVQLSQSQIDTAGTNVLLFCLNALLINLPPRTNTEIKAKIPKPELPGKPSSIFFHPLKRGKVN